MLTLYRSNEKGDLFYYTVHDRQSALFSAFAFTIVKAKGEGRSCEKLMTFDTLEEMESALVAVIRDRIRDGYRILYVFFRSGNLQPTGRVFETVLSAAAGPVRLEDVAVGSRNDFVEYYNVAVKTLKATANADKAVVGHTNTGAQRVSVAL
jgi:hypothetical protein